MKTANARPRIAADISAVASTAILSGSKKTLEDAGFFRRRRPLPLERAHQSLQAFTLELKGQGFAGVGEIESRYVPALGDQNGLTAAEHPRGVIPEFSDCGEYHVTTSVDIVSGPRWFVKSGLLLVPDDQLILYCL